MPIDRTLLKQPVEHLRQMLADNGTAVFPVPMPTAAVVRSAFRFDLSSLGVDTGDKEQLSGALAGLVVWIKYLLQMVPELPPTFYVTFLAFFDTVEGLLDEDLDAAAAAEAARQWGMGGWVPRPSGSPQMGGPGFNRGPDAPLPPVSRDEQTLALLGNMAHSLDTLVQAIGALRVHLTGGQ